MKTAHCLAIIGIVVSSVLPGCSSGFGEDQYVQPPKQDEPSKPVASSTTDGIGGSSSTGGEAATGGSEATGGSQATGGMVQVILN